MDAGRREIVVVGFYSRRVVEQPCRRLMSLEVGRWMAAENLIRGNKHK